MREQAFTKDGQQQYNIVYPKFKKMLLKKGLLHSAGSNLGCTFGKFY